MNVYGGYFAENSNLNRRRRSFSNFSILASFTGPTIFLLLYLKFTWEFHNKVTHKVQQQKRKKRPYFSVPTQLSLLQSCLSGKP